jgi:zinc protease
MKITDRVLRQLGVSLVAEQAGIQEFRLNVNGLKIVLASDPAARVVAVVQHVNVGSRHEGAGNTGYSHLLEHMLFKGTPTHPVGSGHSYDDFMKRHGGIYNATTWLDRTNYFAKIPSFALDAYLGYEADRLRNANLTDADLVTEMPVVVDEFDIGENDPDQILDKRLTATIFAEHPYKVDTIGNRADVMKVTAASLKERLYDVYYWPNNTTLIIVGGFDTVEALKMVVKHYGAIPSSPRPIPVPYTIEPAQLGEQHFVVRKPGDLPRVTVGYHVPQADHPDTLPLHVLSLLLGGTETSKLFRKLVNKGLAQIAYANAQATHDPGVLKLYARLTPGTKPEVVERVMLREVERMRTKLVSATELKRAKVLNRAGTVHLRADKLKFASNLSEHEACADWKWGEMYDDLFDAVTREQILDVAQRYLTAENRTIGYFLPKEEAEQPSEPDTKPAPAPAPAPNGGSNAPAPDSSAPAADTSFAGSVKKVVLSNGLTVLLQPTQSEGAIGLSFATRAGRALAPVDKRMVAQMVASMLTEGSKKYSKARIAELTSEMLVKLNFGSTAFGSEVATHVVPSDLPRFLDLLADVVRNPLFAQAELDLLKTSLAAILETEKQTPAARANTTLMQSFYAPGDAHYVADVEAREAQLAAVTADDLRAFHSRYYSPQGTVLSVVGKFDADAVLKAIESKFGSWTGDAIPAPQAVPHTAGKQANVRINIDGKDNLSILVGLPVDLSADSPDYVAALLANKALGGDTLTSRLGHEIREKRGLTYGITSNFRDPATAGGLWVINMTTNAGKLAQALPLITQVVEGYVRDGISVAELDAEREAMRNQFALVLDTPVNVARQLSSAEQSGEGFAKLDTFDSRVAALTKEQVDEAIRKYFRMADAVTVVAGTLPTA